MSASEVTISLATPGDMPAVLAGLQALAQDLGDPFNARPETVGAALFGASGFALAHLAQRPGADRERPLGVALAEPLFSTIYGGAVTYISDLWVAPAARGLGIGQRLLAASAREGSRRWHARCLKLTVDAANERAGEFYRRLGFVLRESDRAAILAGPALQALSEEAA